MKKGYSIFLLLLFLAHFRADLKAQIKSLNNTSVSIYSSVSDKAYQPLWLVANRQGMFEEFSKGNAAFRFKGNSELNQDKTFDYAYGAEMIGRVATDSRIYFNQLYVTGKASFLQVDVGWKSRVVGKTAGNLSSGSLALGSNSRALPMLNISIPEFTPVPFTYKLLHFKGNLAHGWLEDDRYVSDAYLHEKSFYLKLDREEWLFKPYTGLVHFAQWGGTSENPNVGKLPSGLDDFTRVFVGKGGASNSPGGEQINALGNHFGIWDFGIDLYFPSFSIRGYYQHLFEDKSGLLIRNVEDGLWGININMTERRIISEVALEFIYTKSQSGPGISDPPGDFPYCEEENCGYPYGGRDNYYNHFIYNDGWTYKNRTLGTPLFLSVKQVKQYLNNPDTFNRAIESNRIIGQHVGLGGDLNKYLSYRAMITYVRHYGNYTGLNGGGGFDSQNPNYDVTQYEFYPALDQWSLLLETRYSFEELKDIGFTTSLAYDTGDLTNTIGIMAGATLYF